MVKDLQGFLSAEERDKREKRRRERGEFGWAQSDSICMIDLEMGLNVLHTVTTDTHAHTKASSVYIHVIITGPFVLSKVPRAWLCSVWNVPVKAHTTFVLFYTTRFI